MTIQSFTKVFILLKSTFSSIFKVYKNPAFILQHFNMNSIHVL